VADLVGRLTLEEKVDNMNVRGDKRATLGTPRLGVPPLQTGECSHGC
jgi:hypothetical protein